MAKISATPNTTQGTTIFVTKLGSEVGDVEVSVEVTAVVFKSGVVDILGKVVSPEGTNTESRLQR